MWGIDLPRTPSPPVSPLVHENNEKPPSFSFTSRIFNSIKEKKEPKGNLFIFFIMSFVEICTKKEKRAKWDNEL
jgi:hypothetical protein